MAEPDATLQEILAVLRNISRQLDRIDTKLRDLNRNAKETSRKVGDVDLGITLMR